MKDLSFGNMPEDLQPISKAAEFLGVSIDTIRRLERKGALRAYRPDGKNRYFSQADLQSFLKIRPLPISQVASLLGISTTALRQLEQEGIVKPNISDSGNPYYNQEIIDNIKQDLLRTTLHRHQSELKAKEGVVSESPYTNEMSKNSYWQAGIAQYKNFIQPVATTLAVVTIVLFGAVDLYRYLPKSSQEQTKNTAQNIINNWNLVISMHNCVVDNANW